MSKKNSKNRLIMKSNGKNHLMNTLMYDALRSAGVKEEEARATALEAGQNDLRYLAIEHAFDKLYSHVDKTVAELRKDMADLRKDMADLRTNIIENENRNSRSNVTIMLGGLAVGVTVIIGWITTLLVFLV